MPSRMWHHSCCGSDFVCGWPQCDKCGRQGAFDGWHLSMWESARVYHYVYGLNPFGPHRAYADAALAPMRETCLRCGGRTILTIDVETWCDCPTCEATGGVWNRPFAEVDAVWRDVLARWPGAFLPWRDARARRASTVAAASASAQTEPTGAIAASQSPARLAPPRPRGVSPDGIAYDALRRVFAQAQRKLGTDWQLFGRGHCERVTLKAHYSRHARLGAPESVAHFSPSGCLGRRYVFPAALVRRVASILKIEPDVLISRRV